eukprot:CAMPEP_0119332276 /NCGR_PEP_ID=MMETSP1333-20130426/82404_1 /TAXON_ID=418940 /ORGANISM="Scyphosphaera apsteinii, Strain RCC1455" /LENGTH=56 /DNA_ID=CAMNT_0007342069 /DNA_START=987 /DNA_END=1154 /DNA_ORIENTATION=-
MRRARRAGTPSIAAVIQAASPAAWAARRRRHTAARARPTARTLAPARLLQADIREF